MRLRMRVLLPIAAVLLLPAGGPHLPGYDIPAFQSYSNNPPWRQQTCGQMFEMHGNPSKPRVLPAPKAPLGLQELIIIPTAGAGDVTTGFPQRRTYRSLTVASCSNS